MNYIVYDSATGRILRTGHCAELDLDLQATAPGEAVMEGEADDTLHAVSADGEIVPMPDLLKPAPAPLEEVKAIAAARVDAKAEDVRLRYITPGAGQAGTYIEKAQQADAFAGALYLGAVPPMVQAEADATGQTPGEACDAIRQTRDFWVNVKGPDIERERRRGKVAIDAAADEQGIAAARDAAIAALDAL